MNTNDRPFKSTRPAGMMPVSYGILLLLSAGRVFCDGQSVAQPEAAAMASLERNGARDVRAHDPSTIVKCKDEYWFFATGIGVSSWRFEGPCPLGAWATPV
jgi:hypothetical protein